MSETNKLTVSASPHIKGFSTVTGIMLDVIIALIPAAFAGVAVFGVTAALVIAVCIISCVAFNYCSLNFFNYWFPKFWFYEVLISWFTRMNFYTHISF